MTESPKEFISSSQIAKEQKEDHQIQTGWLCWQRP